MGILIVGAFMVAALASGTVGIVLSVLHALAVRRGRGSWRVFAVGALGLAAVMLAAGTGACVLLDQHTGAPTGEDYESALWAAAAFGTALGAFGTAVGAGLVAFFTRSSIKKGTAT